MADYRQDTVRALYDQGLDNIVVTSVNEVKARDETIANLQAQLDAERQHSAKLLAGYPDGMTPSDIEHLYRANAGLADENFRLRECLSTIVECWDCNYTATRRAIVRAAAEIGRSQPEKGNGHE